MILLDTDHFTVFMDDRDRRHELLCSRLDAEGLDAAITIVSVEEVLRGWLAAIHRLRDVHRQLPAYSRLGQLFNVLSDWHIISFDQAAADTFASLRRGKNRIGTMDLKIASIALVHDWLLLTTNLRDFSQVPELRCENWLEE
jgi:tRNA(fMet)-specific endonuclease VapC